MPKTLAIVANPNLSPEEIDLLRILAARDARVIAWQHPSIVQERFPSPDVAAALAERGVENVSLSKALGEQGDLAVDEAVIAWMKTFGKTPLSSQGTFRTLFRYGKLSLWWWAELFLYHDTPLRLFVRDIEAMACLLEKERPQRLILIGSIRDLSHVALRLHGEVERYGATIRFPTRPSRTSLRFLSALMKTLGTGLKSMLRPAPPPEASRKFLFLTHASMWRRSPQPARRRPPAAATPVERRPGGERGVSLLLMEAAAGRAGAVSPSELPSEERGSLEPWDGVGPYRIKRSQTDESGESELVEMYLGQILKALDPQGEQTRVVAVGPTVPFKQRRLTAVLRDVLELGERGRPFLSIRRYASFSLSLAMLKASVDCWLMWRRFRRLPLLDQAMAHRGIPLSSQAFASFRDAFLLQVPWAIRSYREIETLLRRERPALLVLYAEYSGLGRAAVAAACEASVPSFAVQHGILYPRLYANEHSPDEVGAELDGVDAVPLPTRTAVFGSLARDLLVERGHYPPERIVITGSPKFDALVEAGRHFSREKARQRMGLAADVPMLVVASRFTAIGPVFEDLIRAVEAIDDLWLLVKPHQAERADAYRRVGTRVRASRLRILTSEENLHELLFASDGLITVDSFASSEALVLGRPVMVVNLPSNLSALVERGVALGVRSGEPIEPALRRFLYDPDLGRELERQRKKYLEEFAYGADGSSTARIVSAIQETAKLGEAER